MKKQFLLLVSSLFVNYLLTAQEPDWSWVRFLNSNQSDEFTDVATDQLGNAYVCGTFFGPSVTFGGQTFNSVENSAAILVKRDPNGGLVWAKVIDGGECNAVSVDLDGNCFITGYFTLDSIDFGNSILYNPARFNTSTIGATNSAAFLVKYDPSGTVLWAKSFDNQIDASSAGNTIATDASGNCYLAGTFLLFNSIPGSELTINGISLSMYPGSGLSDVFLLKYNQNGEFQWIRTAGGESYEEPYDIAIDASGNLAMVGIFSGNIMQFDANSSVVQNNSPIDPFEEFFFARYSPDGDFISVKQSFAPSSVRCTGLATDTDGNYFLTGYFGCDTLTFEGAILINSDTIPNPVSSPPVYFEDDIFLIKLNSAGELLWAQSFGQGSESLSGDYANGIACDSDGNCYITGSFRTAINFGGIELTSNGFSDLFLAKFDPNGTSLWAKNAGGSSSESGDKITVDNANNVFIAGSYANGPLDQSFNFGSTQAPYLSSRTGYLAKLGFNTVGIEEKNGAVKIAISPNPSNGNFTLQLNSNAINNKAKLNITDVSGRVVHSQELLAGNNEISTQGALTSGLYFLNVAFLDGSVSVTEPFVIQ